MNGRTIPPDRRRPAPGLARAGRHRRPVPRRPRAQAGLAAGHAAAGRRRARRAQGRQARVREGLGQLGQRPRRRRPRSRTTARRATPGWTWSSATSLGWKTTSYARTPTVDAAGRRGPLARPTRSPSARPARSSHGDTIGALVLVIDPVDSLRDPLADGWAASPIDRMEELLRTAGVPIGVVTDGRWWAIVCARPRDHGRVRHRRRADLDRGTAARERVHRAAASPPADRRQARGPADRAVRGLGRRRRGDHRGARHPGPPGGRAARPGVVRGRARRRAARRARPAARRPRRGLPGGRHGHDAGGVPALRRGTRPAAAEPAVHRRLRHQRRARRPRRSAPATRAAKPSTPPTSTWHRLLATSQALYRGATSRTCGCPSYGGSLFDPARFPFLTATRRPRHSGDHGQRPGHAARSCAPSRSPSCGASPPGGSPSATSTSSRSATSTRACSATPARDVDEVTVGLIGKEGEEPEIPLTTLEELAGDASDRRRLRRRDPRLGQGTTSPPPRRRPRPRSPRRIRRRAARSRTPNARCAPSTTRRRRCGTGSARSSGIIRRDLRDRPTGRRAAAACSWSRRRPARPPARTTRPGRSPRRSSSTRCEPLVYDPGPHQQRRDGWVPVDSDRDPRPQGRRHRLRLRRVPRRRRPLPRRPTRRGLAARGRPSPA